MSVHNKNQQKGQVLLIIIMLVATVLTVVTTTSFRSTTDTQRNQLEEDSQQALAAAEAGIEKAIGDQISSGSYLFDAGPSGLNLTNLSGIDLSSSTVNVSTNITNEFVTPLIQKDQQYTIYLAEYNTATNEFTNPYNGTIRIEYGSESSCSTLALEISVVSGNSPYTVQRYIADQNNLYGSEVDDIYTSGSITLDGTTFNCRTTTLSINPANAPKLLIVRTIGDKTRIGISGNTNLSPQGKYIISKARSNTGVIKEIQLFQSYPQIPAEFFVSTF